MLRIIIAGCGEIGSRHLQALSLLQESAEIYLIDPSIESMQNAEQRFYDALSNDRQVCNFSLIRSRFDLLPTDVDIAIIATTSSNRSTVIQNIYKYCTPRNLLLEKFLFDNLADYDTVSSLLKRNQTSAWTNQWMSSSYPFIRIYDWFSNKPIKMHVSGEEWGLACNSLHFIDLFDSMNNYQDLKIVDADLDPEALPAKREGFVEFTGNLSIASSNGASLKLESSRGCFDGTIKIEIKNDEKSCDIVLFNGKLICTFHCKDKEWSESFKITFQSYKTNRLVQDILIKKNIFLPSYQRSSYQHKLVFSVFESHLMNRCGQKTTGCPVT